MHMHQKRRSNLEDKIIGVRGPISIAEQLMTQSRSTMKRDSKQKRSRRVVPAPKPRQVEQDSSNRTTLKPPKHLKASKSWWLSIVATYELEQHQMQILLVAAEALELRDQARAALKKFGLVYIDERGMIRSRPETAIEREASNSFLRALRALKLEGLES
jgi:hypothetical protein